MKLTSYSDTGRTSAVTVSEQLFGAKPNQVLIAQATRVYLSNLRQVSAHAKTRSEVNRTKKKWYKQKGTGNARHGARSAHIFVGGGVAHGPNVMKHWRMQLSTGQRRQALISALSWQAPVIKLVSLTKVNGKTKEACQVLDHCQAKDKVLLVLSKSQPEIVQSFRNLRHVLITSANNLNALEVVSADQILMQKEAVSVLESRLGLANLEPRQVKAVAVKPEAKKPAAAKKTKVTKIAKTTKTARPSTKAKATAKAKPVKTRKKSSK